MSESESESESDRKRERESYERRGKKRVSNMLPDLQRPYDLTLLQNRGGKYHSVLLVHDGQPVFSIEQPWKLRRNICDGWERANDNNDMQ